MLIGFIVVIVMILVIVGLMATGNSGGGTGVNQTKATKVVTEIGTLAQSLSFFKTTTTAGDFSGFTHDAGVALLDGYTATASIAEGTLGTTGGVDVNGNGSIDGTAIANGVVSQAVSSLSYVFSTNTSKQLVISAILGGTDTALNTAIGTTINSKLAGGNFILDITGLKNAGSYVANDVIKVITK